MQLIMCMLHSLYRMLHSIYGMCAFRIWDVSSTRACAYGASLPCRMACQRVLRAWKRSHLPLT